MELNYIKSRSIRKGRPENFKYLNKHAKKDKEIFDDLKQVQKNAKKNKW